MERGIKGVRCKIPVKGLDRTGLPLYNVETNYCLRLVLDKA